MLRCVLLASLLGPTRCVRRAAAEVLTPSGDVRYFAFGAESR